MVNLKKFAQTILGMSLYALDMAPNVLVIFVLGLIALGVKPSEAFSILSSPVDLIISVLLLFGFSILAAAFSPSRKIHEIEAYFSQVFIAADTFQKIIASVFLGEFFSMAIYAITENVCLSCFCLVIITILFLYLARE